MSERMTREQAMERVDRMALSRDLPRVTIDNRIVNALMAVQAETESRINTEWSKKYEAVQASLEQVAETERRVVAKCCEIAGRSHTIGCCDWCGDRISDEIRAAFPAQEDGR